MSKMKIFSSFSWWKNPHVVKYISYIFTHKMCSTRNKNNEHRNTMLDYGSKARRQFIVDELKSS